jgi:hypothetical protein
MADREISDELAEHVSNIVNALVILLEAEFPSDAGAQLTVLMTAYAQLGIKAGMTTDDMKSCISTILDKIADHFKPVPKKTVLN